ncbi:cadherin-like domain-containing protein [Vibrio sp. D420a]|uniref:cadherin-like domain-containing protein n=1 Tax=Vibrio sp. D420a TaxID=2836895 RepID=UPI0025569D0F|nr:cadherin-like domain-containing protein [Vibrio sp. D420a]MDK9764716.1 cadherin-like domain-containing protein [Vibrio sp. D420a]
MDSKRNSKSQIGVAITVFSALISLSSYADQNVLNNGNLRFIASENQGGVEKGSVDSWGNLYQPHYFNGVDWSKLTYGDFALDFAIAAGGDGQNNWNTNGVFASTDNNSPYINDLTINSDQYISTGSAEGYGTIIASGTLYINGQSIELSHSYTLSADTQFISTKTTVTNTSDSRLNNLRVWVGTRDDWIGEVDAPNKTRGNIINGEFIPLSQTTDSSNAIKVESADDSVLFYSQSPNVASVVAGYGTTFYPLYTQDPNNSEIYIDGADCSYGLFMRLPDLETSESVQFDWNYSGGQAEDLAAMISELSAITDTTIPLTEDHDVSFDATSFQDNTEATFPRIKIQSLPTNGRLMLNETEVTEGLDIDQDSYSDLRYEPAPNFFGEDSFIWQGWDSSGGTWSDDVNIELSISPVNDAPYISDPEQILSERQEDGRYIIDVLNAALDIDSTNITVSHVSVNGDHGSVEIGLDGRITFTPNAEFHGTAQINFTISDGDGGQIDGSVTVGQSSSNNVIASEVSMSGGAFNILFGPLLLLIARLRSREQNTGKNTRIGPTAVLMLLPVVAKPAFSQECMETPSCLDQQKFYVSGQIGYSNTDATYKDIEGQFSTNSGKSHVDNGGISYSALVGYHVNDYLAIETGYLNLGRRSVSLTPDQALQADVAKKAYVATGHGLTTSLIGSYPITDNWAALGKVGAFVWQSQAKAKPISALSDSQKYHGTDLIVGLGTHYQFSDHWQFYSMADFMKLEQQNIINLSIGARYSFDL